MSAFPPRVVPADLWARLEAFDMDGVAPLSFSKRLGRDNGWSPAFARRVVLEYKKFVFLAATCAHPVTPSDEVDQAWHLHLVYTRSYWDELCGQVLGFPLHHGPTQGGTAEGDKFQDWYARTLQSYEAAFGMVPPPDIWPPAAVRFGDGPYFRRINLRRHWLLPRPRWPYRLDRRGWLALLALLLVGCTARMPLNPLNWYGIEFLCLFWGLFAALVPLTLWLCRRGSGPEDEYSGPPPSTYELVRLAGRGEVLAVSALAALLYAGKAEVVPGRRVKRTDAEPPDEPYERAVWNLIIPNGTSDVDKVIKQAEGANIGALRALDESLEAKGLLLPVAQRQRLDQIPQLVALGLGLLGLAKLVVGANRDRPIGFLLMSLVGLCIALVIYQKGYSAWATGRGTRLLRDIIPAVRQDQHGDARSAHIVALSVALFGIGELRALGMGTVIPYLRPINEGNGGADGGSGCSGGDGGGSSGCGGCGGCGGGGD